MVMRVFDLSKVRALLFALKLTPVLFLGACQTLPNYNKSVNNSSAPVIKVVAQQSPIELVQGTENISPTPPQAFEAVAPSTHKLWGRIRSGFAISQLGGNAARLQSIHEKWYRERPEHLERVFTRAQLYLFDIVEATEQSGLPLEIALLPAVESAFMPTASSSAAADGLWQFIAPTARRYDLKVHLFLDQRRDVRAATRAALRYLQDLRLRYGGDMQLALAAYNCGEGCIDEHIRRAKARGLQGRFEDLDLNRETANYVPRLLALTKLVAEGVDNNRMSPLGLPPMQNAPYFAAVPIRRDIDVSRAADLCGLSLQEFKALNPQHKKPVIVATAREEVLVPIDRANAFAEALLNNHGPMSTWTTVVVNQPTLPSVLAGRHGTSTKTLLEVNGIKPGHLIKTGSTVLVPRDGTAGEITSAVSESAVINTTPIVVSMKVTVRRGESWKHLVARMNAQGLRVTANMIQTYNPKLRLRAGPMTIRIPSIAQATTT
jgi:membrane-bound lytic murein transglycosylase D